VSVESSAPLDATVHCSDHPTYGWAQHQPSSVASWEPDAWLTWPSWLAWLGLAQLFLSPPARLSSRLARSMKRRVHLCMCCASAVLCSIQLAAISSSHLAALQEQQHIHMTTTSTTMLEYVLHDLLQLPAACWAEPLLRDCAAMAQQAGQCTAHSMHLQTCSRGRVNCTVLRVSKTDFIRLVHASAWPSGAVFDCQRRWGQQVAAVDKSAHLTLTAKLWKVNQGLQGVGSPAA
jgi:hypothetical protein